MGFRASAGQAAVGLLIVRAAAAATLSVPADYPTIQSCIAAAVDGVDTCLVAPGTYPETINFLGKAIAVRSASGSAVTVIDATGLDCGNVCSVVTCASGEGSSSVLHGFTIRGGRGTDFGDGVRRGGGMFASGTSPTVTSCTFTKNSATVGGGICGLESAPTYLHAVFIGNTADYGGAMFHQNQSNPTVRDCAFSGNAAVVAGGAMAFDLFSHADVTDCIFDTNTAQFGAGLYVSTSSHPTLTDCVFNDNVAETAGGGAYNNSSLTIVDSRLERNGANFGGGLYNALNSSAHLSRCGFIGNSAQTSGAGLYNNSSPLVTNCTFIGNVATMHGGGTFNIGGFATMTNCVFSGNQAERGGGMFTADGSPTLTHCTFSGNTGLYGGGLFNFANGAPTVTSGVLWGDTPDEIFNVGISSVPTVRSTSVAGGLPSGTIDGGDNLHVDPLFVDPDGDDDDVGTEDDNLRLSPGSPCIDAANNLLIPPDAADVDGDGDTTERTPLDLDDRSRFVDDPSSPDTGFPDPPIYTDIADRGAFEFQGATCSTDAECDDENICTIEFCDLDAVFSPSVGCIEQPVLAYGDVNNDGFANIDDVFCLLDSIGGNSAPDTCGDRTTVGNACTDDADCDAGRTCVVAPSLGGAFCMHQVHESQKDIHPCPACLETSPGVFDCDADCSITPCNPPFVCMPISDVGDRCRDPNNIGDGFLNPEDVNAVLNALGGIPAPELCVMCSAAAQGSSDPSRVRYAAGAPRASIFLVPSHPTIAPGRRVALDVFVRNATDLQAYQVAVGVTGGRSGRFISDHAVIHQTRPKYIFPGRESLSVANPRNALIANVLHHRPGVDSRGDAYLGTIFFRASNDADGEFHFTFRTGGSGTFLRTASSEAIDTAKASATVTVPGDSASR